VFHVHNYYVRQQAPPFKVRKCVADQQPSGTIPKLQVSYFSGFPYALTKNYEIRDAGQV
jgi:hypothetical protein